MKKIYIPIVLFVSLGLGAFAQDKSSKEVRGDKYYKIYSFERAIHTYTHTKNLTIEGQRRLAQSYTHSNQDVLAEETWAKICAESGASAEDFYNYAMVLKTTGKYDLSATAMDKFLLQKPNDLRAKSYAAHKSELATLMQDNGRFKVQHLDINTDAEDFGASYYQEQVVFASSREIPKKMILRKSNWTGKPYMDLYVSDVENNQLKSPKKFGGKLNGKMNDGPASFSNNGTFMAFTKNNVDVKRKNRIVNLEIFFSSMVQGNWSKPTPFEMNNIDYSVGQPCLTADGLTMYFTSDMPGGFGGSDIYRTTRDGSGKWSKAENLGDKINTEGDEMFPFYEENKGIMFFSSNGRFGLGGMDVFTCSMSDSGFGPVSNAGTPLNSRYDDFSVVLNGKTNKGYISSNREGGSGGDDMYSFDYLSVEKQIKGIAKEKDGKAIPRTFITLMDEQGKMIDTLTTKEGGAYSFKVEQGKNFKLLGKKPSFNDGSNTASTMGKEDVVTADVTLTVIEVAKEKKLKVGDDLAKILAFNPNKIYFDYNKFNIRKDAEADLGNIVKIMNEYPDMVVELGSHTDCRGSKAFNQVLSDKRAKASAEYIKQRISKPERIYGKGYGETKLINGCSCEGNVPSTCPEGDQQNNRRTEFIIVKK